MTSNIELYRYNIILGSFCIIFILDQSIFEAQEIKEGVKINFQFYPAK